MEAYLARTGGDLGVMEMHLAKSKGDSGVKEAYLVEKQRALAAEINGHWFVFEAC